MVPDVLVYFGFTTTIASGLYVLLEAWRERNTDQKIQFLARIIPITAIGVLLMLLGVFLRTWG